MRRSSGKSASLVVACLVLVCLCSSALRAQSAVVKQNVNLRAGPSSSTALIRTLEPGDELTLVRPDTVERYVQVRTASGAEGWVYTPRIRVLDAPVPLSGPPEVFRGCGLEGNASSARRRESNRLKNRVQLVQPSDVDSTVSLEALLTPGDDVRRWSSARAAVVEGFVVDVKKGGEETANCGDTDERFRDTHIEIALAITGSLKRERMIVEITPKWREHLRLQGIDWSTTALKSQLIGKRVRFTGWLFFDDEHDDESENTRPGRPENWRGTAWELHPVTALQIVR